MIYFSDFGVSYSDPNLNFTKLLMGFEGADGSTAFVDESPIGRTADIGFAGNAQIDTAQFKFGASSLLLDGTGDGISVADSPDWTIGTGPFGLDVWQRPSVSTGARWIMGQGTNLSNGTDRSFALWTFNGIPRFSYIPTGSTTWVDGVVGSVAMPNSAQSMLSLDRDSSNVMRLYIDGVVQASATVAADIKAVASDFRIGQSSDGQYGYAGHLDELRVMNGAAPWGGAFTPPTAAFDRL